MAKGRLPGEFELNAEDRIAWLLLQDKERQAKPQPWMQLRDLLKAKGDDNGAKHVVYKLRCVQTLKSSFLSQRFKIAFAYLEEAPQRILWSIAFTLLLCTSIFWHAGAIGALTPTDKDAYADFVTGKPFHSAYPKLNPFVYTLENALPLAKLGQDDKWAPDLQYTSKNWLTNYWFLTWVRLILVAWGWFQAGILGATVVRRFAS